MRTDRRVAEWLTGLRLRLTARLRGRPLEQDLQDEMAFHVAMRADALRRAGLDDAKLEARRRFGSVARTADELRDAWALAPGPVALARDFRYAVRSLRRAPGFTAVVVLTLALGIGATSAVFTIVNAVLIRPLGYAAEDRLVALHENFPASQIERWPFSALDFEDLRRYSDIFDEVSAYRSVPFELAGDGRPERVQGASVSANLFRTLRIDPIIGRTFSPDDERPGARVAVLSWGLWHRRYSADAGIVGRQVRLDREPYTVVGVMPRTFVFPHRGPRFNNQPADIWVPMTFTALERLERGSHLANSVVARLKDGVDVLGVQAHLDVISRRLADNYPPAVLNAGFAPHLSALPLREEIVGRYRYPLFMLLLSVGLVLLVACTNLGSLILSRVTGRTREFAIRSALGAGRGRILRLLFCEGLLLSLTGTAMGLLLAAGLVRGAPTFLAESLPGFDAVGLDGRVFTFAAALAFATGLLFAVLPLAALDRRRPGDAMRDSAPAATPSRRALRVQHVCVVTAVGLAVVLLAGAGLLLRSYAVLAAVDPGFQPAHVVTVSLTLPRPAYPTPGSVDAFQRRLLDGLTAVPGVHSAALASDLPLTAAETRRFEPDGSPIGPSVTPITKMTSVRGPYFETLGVSLVQGRSFSDVDHTEARQVVIVNRTLAKRFWPGDHPIGKRLKWGAAASQYPWLTVVGVVGDVVQGPLGGNADPHAYEPFRQLPPIFLGRHVDAVVRAEGAPQAVAARLRDEILRLDPQLAVERVEPITAQLGAALAPQRFSTTVVAVFAAGSLLLAWIGLFGLLAFTVARRRQEIAVRLALGAGPRAVARLVIAHGARLVGPGLLAGVAVSLAVTRLLTSLLYGTEPYDVMTFVAVPMVVVTAALLACAVPAWRAAHIDPLAALRAE
jgi:predicted permease